MLRDLLLNGVSFLPFRAADDGGSPPPSAEEGAAPPLDGEEESGAPADGTAPPASEAAPAPPPAQPGQPPRDWRDTELRKRSDKIKDLRTENERMRLLIEAQNGRQAPAPAPPAADHGAAPPAPAPTPAPRAAVSTESEDERVERRAVERDEQRQYAREIEAAAAKGLKDYAETWQAALNQLETLSAPTDGIPVEIMQEILATDDAAKVIHDLGRSPDTYQEVMDLPKAKRMARFVRMAMPAEVSRRPVSEAPEPVEQVARAPRPGPAKELLPANVGIAQIDDKTMRAIGAMEDQEWYAMRAQQKRNSVGRPWSPKH